MCINEKEKLFLFPVEKKVFLIRQWNKVLKELILLNSLQQNYSFIANWHMDHADF